MKEGDTVGVALICLGYHGSFPYSVLIYAYLPYNEVHTM